MVVWGCGRALLAKPSLGEEEDGSKGVGSCSLGGASMFTFALILASLVLYDGALEGKEHEEQGAKLTKFVVQLL